MATFAVGNHVRRARLAAGLTQEALAAATPGVSLRTLSLIENGQDTRLSTLSALAAALDVPLADLVADDEPDLAAS